MLLQGPDGVCELHVSFALVASLEARHGSLYAVAERLLDKSLPLSEMIVFLTSIYTAAGCAEEGLEEFFLTQPCAQRVQDVLLHILGRVDSKGDAPPETFMREMMNKFPDGEKA